MSTGLRCISTDMGESKSIVDKFGWIIKTNDLDSLVSSIKVSMNQSNEERHIYEKGGREHIIKHFTLEKMLAKYTILYRSPDSF
jgi:glycosyltransferase involved in cell wall biosynthesis